MTLTEMQWGIALGVVTSVILILFCWIIHLTNQVRLYRSRMLDAVSDCRMAEMDKLIMKKEYDTLVFMREEASKEELTPDEIDYLHRTLGIQIPAQRSNSDGRPSIL